MEHPLIESPHKPVWRGTLQPGPGAEPLAFPTRLQVSGWPLLAETLATQALHPQAVLVQAEAQPKPETVIQACQAFADSTHPGEDALIVIILRGHARGLAHLAGHAANAALWAFTQEAALAWATRGVRVNAIGLGASPFRPFAPGDQAAPSPARPATPAEAAATVAAIGRWPSMTGQIIRLG